MSINPTPLNITSLFAGGKEYYIDFYQRDYQWKVEQMSRLLDDLFYRFSLEYKPTLDPTKANISRFDWYYLNAFVTNDYDGNTYIVDGQQRLTSLTLILIKLYHMAQEMNLETNQIKFLEQKVRGPGMDGPTYWMGHGQRTDVLEDLFQNQKQTLQLENSDISLENMYKNFAAASNMLNDFLTDDHKLEAFTRYFLTRVMLVRIDIQNTKDVPMVFEVINDRGVSLKPYEVLKGKLLGQIEKGDIDPYHEIWQELVHQLQRIEEGQVDTFFRFYFRAKYADNRTQDRAFLGDYHKTIYEDEWAPRINLKQNPPAVKRFVKEDMQYFANLYARIVQDAKSEKTAISPYLYFNDLNDQDRQFLLILSACVIDDPNEATKVRLISRLFDRHFTLLQLTGTYDSNLFTESIVNLNRELRDQPLNRIASIYRNQILQDISNGLGVEVTEPLQWRHFKEASKRNMGNRFLKYYFARIDHFLAKHLRAASTHSYYDLVRKRGYKYGYDIEHILANNEENLSHFAEDEELFHHERNRLGALVLLQGRDNKASQNESYLKKRRIYGRTLIWNKTLHPDFYHKHKDLEELKKDYGLDLHPVDKFDLDAIDYRQKLLFRISKILWDPEADADLIAGGDHGQK